MQVSKNNISIHRGEYFSMNRTVQYDNGEPFIVSNEFVNPYLLISVSDYLYYQDDRYILNHWLSLKNTPRFTLTQPLDLQELKTSSSGIEARFDKFSDVTFPITSVYINGQFVSQITEEYAVFYNSLEPNEGYKYWDGSSWKNYDFSFVDTFVSEETRNWISKKYQYNISLVDGILVRDYLQSLIREYSLDITDDEMSQMDNYELYNILLNKGAHFSENFSINQPVLVDSSFVILTPHFIYVSSYIEGGNKWQ